ncbi:MAG: hypothetical protein JWM93_3995 [Frankiales bacterium]|nr:hypothetical protein [Frankiales bacterium]
MKALSLSRPWTTLVLEHGKDVENRGRGTQFRGTLLVHGAKSWDDAAYSFADRAAAALGFGSQMSPWPEQHPMGLLGTVDVLGCCTAALVNEACTCGPWAMPDQAHWAIANPRTFPRPIPCRGALGLWTPAPDVLERVYEHTGRPPR